MVWIKLGLPACLCLSLVQPAHSGSENRLESWYTYWGLGYADNAYPDELEEVLDDLEDQPGVDHLPLSMDMFGFYWPRGESTLVGVIANASADTYERDGDEMSIYNYLLAPSVMHFLTNRIGQGPFVRADLGLARHVVEADIAGTRQEADSEWGTGVLVGGGMGFPVTSGTRMLVNGTFAFRRVESETTTTVGISVNGLF